MDNACLHCGQANRPTAKFCANCGKALPVALAAGGAGTALQHAPVAINEPQAAALPCTAAVEVTSEPPPLERLAAADLSALAPLTTEPPSITEEASAPPGVASASAGSQSTPANLPTSGEEPLPGPTSPFVNGQVEASSINSAAPMTDGEPETARAPTAQPMLPVGTLLAERYYVVGQVEDSAGQMVYQVEDQGVCRSCGVAVQATEEEPYCFNCGAHLLQATLPWPLLTLRAVMDEPTNPHLFIWQAHAFVLEDTEASQTSVTEPPGPPPFANGVNLLVGQRSHVGVGRTAGPDEDSILACTLTGIYETKAQPTLGLYIVADGMGGHGDGEVASRLTTETIATALLPTLFLPLIQGEARSAPQIVEQLEQAIQLANQRVYKGAQARGNDMGTTLTLAFVVNDQAYIANVGDSRTYLWGQQGLRQITQDHSHVYSLYKNGALREEGIYTHPRRNEIYRSLGIGSAVTIDHFQEQLTPGDLLLLCCDGLWEMVRNDGLVDVLMLNLGEPQIICDELVSRANVAGGEDNISVVIVRAVA